MKVSIELLIERYEELGSVWAVGEAVGLCGQSVHERLSKAGVVRSRAFTEEELGLIREWYEENAADLRLIELSAKMGRQVTSIARVARRLGLTDESRAKAQRVVSSTNKGGRWQGKDHPKGFAGKSHSKASRGVISQKSKIAASSRSEEDEANRVLRQLKTKEKNGTLVPPRHGNWKAGWYEIGEHKLWMRSSWEYNYALLLEEKKRAFAIKDWLFEPDTFWFEQIRRGVRSYLPDFKIIWPDGSLEYHEVKGWMDQKSRTKIKRMAKYYPDVVLVVLQKKAYEWAINNRAIPNEQIKKSPQRDAEGVPDWLGA